MHKLDNPELADGIIKTKIFSLHSAYLLSASYVPGIVLNPENVLADKIDKKVTYIVCQIMKVLWEKMKLGSINKYMYVLERTGHSCYFKYGV